MTTRVSADPLKILIDQFLFRELASDFPEHNVRLVAVSTPREKPARATSGLLLVFLHSISLAWGGLVDPRLRASNDIDVPSKLAHCL
jgi:hypothetical protein